MSERPPMPSQKVIELAYDAQLKKMLGLIAVWASFFIGLIGILVALIGRSTSLGLLVRTLLVCLAAALAVLDACLTMAILSKFQELVFLEKQPQINLTSFYAYLDDQKIRFSGARWWDGVVRKRILLVSDEELRSVEQYNYLRIGKRLNALMFGIWVVLFFLWVSVLVASAAPFDLVTVNQSLISPSGSIAESLNWIEIILSFLATLLGVILAFRLERWREEKSRKERLIGALEMIRDEIEGNVNLCRQILQEFVDRGPSWIQYYNLKTTTWEGVSSVIVDLKDSNLSKKIANQYYQYYHMNRKIDARFDFFKFVGTSDTRFSNLTTAVSEGAKSLLDDGERLIPEIEKRISGLRDC
jgi:hypothetical protein